MNLRITTPSSRVSFFQTTIRPIIFAAAAAATIGAVLFLNNTNASAAANDEMVTNAAANAMYVPAVTEGEITGLEQRLLTGINAEREAAGLAPLTYDVTASTIARTRSQQMADQNYFGHQDPQGYTPYVELLANYDMDYNVAGENLALNNYGEWESPERAIVSLMKSPGHRANILANDFTSVGIGEVTDANGRHIYSMVFLG